VRAVLDTNVLLSGLLWSGAPHALVERLHRGTLNLVSSPALLAELTAVVSRSKFDVVLARSQISREDMLNAVRRLAQVVDPPPLHQPVCRDPDDDAILALALAAQADLIVSGDSDLLSLKQYQNIPIVTPTQALQFIEKA
jgi:uncharacterized protein